MAQKSVYLSLCNPQSEKLYDIPFVISVQLRFEKIQLDMSASNFIFVISICECLYNVHFFKKSNAKNL